MSLLRVLPVAFAVMVLVISTAGSVEAAEPDSAEAIVVDAAGGIVSIIDDRADAATVFEQVFMASPGHQLRLEYIYVSHGVVSNPPNDPLFAEQWHLERTGTAAAWARSNGEGVVVAVLDSAINFTGFDGFCTKVIAPYDAIAQTAGLAGLNATAQFGHGTHVTGSIAQCTANARGAAGVAPGATLMPVRVLSDSGQGTSSELARGIDWAVNHGADIINLSLGADCESLWPTCSDSEVDAAIDRAGALGVLLVASSGNGANSFVAYPSNRSDVVSVGAIDDKDTVWNDGSDLGSSGGTALNLVAPGTSIIQETTSYGAYGYYEGTGTSMAAAQVSGAAALMLSVNPMLAPGIVMDLLIATAADVGPAGFDVGTGWGRLNTDAAVLSAMPVELSEDPCTSPQCDVLAFIDTGGMWGIWDQLYQATSISTFYFGNPGDRPFMGDWDGSRIATPGLYRQSDGFVYIRDTNTQGVADTEFFFGNPGDVPLVGDFDGDGKDSVSIWRPSEARVFVINSLGEDGEGLGAADFDFYFGNTGDTPFVGDFDGDGVDTVGLYREATGFVYLTNALETGNAELAFYYGDPGDQVLVGDWDGDGDDSIGVYRPSSGIVYLNMDNAGGAADWSAYLGRNYTVVTAGQM